MTHDTGLRPAVVADPTWETALRNVLGGRGLRLVAQPIIDVAQARVGGYELLARFDGPPARSPDVWFEEARSRDLDGPLTIQVLHALHRLRTDLPAGTFCTVNVEPHLLARDDVRDALLGNGRLDGVVVELTEHVSAGDGVVLCGALDAVREVGGLIAMDDAGQGHSGLARMIEVRPDLIKLDRALVAGIDQDPMKKAVVQLVGDLAGQLDAWILAEGVETERELAEVIRMGVPLVQGWAVGRPADGWPGLAEDARRFVADTQERTEFGDNVLALVRPATVRPPNLDRDGGEPGSVLVDSHGRAVSVVVVDPSGRSHDVPAMLVAPSSVPADVLRRAMTRPLGWHSAPLVCTDVRGGVLGLVEVRDLVDHVLSKAS
ncbi:EAL domain-containing protein [uncultured Cellulomonas sp.]|uniref:EAL domain-containing protein n=1 Tax=uncultured Cellulomonas sp. TaxID=189682 RepID=UPI0026084ECF|nr:EAL domain-containing protein [uncultured Cellulomonas sp.]